MGDPRKGWWTISGEEIYAALCRVADGDHPEVVWLELVGSCETETVEGE